MVLLVKSWRRNVLYHNSPDGGWAWVVLVAGFSIMAIGFSIARSLGIFYNDFAREYNSSNSQTSWISSLATSMLGLAAPLGGIVMRKLDARKLVMMSGIFSCLGMVISVFATHIWMVYVGIGVIWGVGFSWSYVATVSQINIYFKRWRGLANGVMVCGSAVGGITLPILSQYLVSAYGWRGTMLIFAGLGLNLCVFGALVRPIRVLTGAQMAKYRDLEYADKATDINDIQAMTVSLEVLDYIDQAEQQDVVETKSKAERAAKFCSDYWVLMLYGGVEFALGLAMFIPVIFINPYAKSIGCTDEQAAFILSMTAIGDVVTRPLSGLALSCFPVLEKRILFFLACLAFVQSLLCALATYAAGFEMLVTYAVLYGCLYGSIVTVNTTGIGLLLGADNIEKFIGPLIFLSGIASLFSPPIAGYLVDVYDSFRVAYWYGMAGFFILFVLYLACGIGVARLGALLPQHRKRKVGKTP